MIGSHIPNGTLLGGRFRVVGALGSGGLGAVYEIQHEITHHRRALKVLHVNRPESAERLLREASAAGRIGSPHIVETFDAGQLEGGEPYIVMELLHGESLASLFKRKGRLSIARLAALVVQACEGLQAAHDAGIVHRDVKPANLFITSRDRQPFVKVFDFGVSKFDSVLTDETELTQQGDVVGTPSFLSPEQLRGLTIDGRVDVYALGVVLYIGASGKAPFAARGPIGELALRIVTGDHPALRDIAPDVAPDFAAVVARAMATDRDMRYPTARDLADALRPFVSDEETLAEADLATAEEAADALTVDAPAAEAVSAVRRTAEPTATSAPSSSAPRVPRSALGIIALALCLAAVVVLVVSTSLKRPPTTARSASAPAEAPSDRVAATLAGAPLQPPPEPVESAAPRSQPAMTSAASSAAPLPRPRVTAPKRSADTSESTGSLVRSNPYR